MVSRSFSQDDGFFSKSILDSPDKESEAERVAKELGQLDDDKELNSQLKFHLKAVQENPRRWPFYATLLGLLRSRYGRQISPEFDLDMPTAV